MGNQKLKWTAEEEETLLAGVRKHGPGKWKNILRDPEFAEQLCNRSNIDLKDKWRNLSVAPGIQGSKDKIRTPKIKAAAFKLAVDAALTYTHTPTLSANSSPVAALARSGSSDLSIEDTCNVVFDSKNAPRYDGMIFEALSALPDEDGSDVNAIFNFVEKKHEVPPNFKRVLSSRLRRLAAQKKLEKTQNFYKMNDYSLVTRPSLGARPKENNVKARQTNSQKPSVSETKVVDASATAAFKLVEVDNLEDGFDEVLEEEERMKRLKEEADYMLVIAIELHEQCSHGEVVELAWG